MSDHHAPVVTHEGSTGRSGDPVFVDLFTTPAKRTVVTTPLPYERPPF